MNNTSKRFRAVICATRCSTVAFLGILVLAYFKDVSATIIQPCFKILCMLIGMLFGGYGASRLMSDKKEKKDGN